MTPTQRAACMAALEALEETIDNLRAALAEPEVEQEPVAITTKTQIEEMQHGYSRAIVGRDPKFWLVKRDDDVPLYTAPPRREWQSLTDEEIFALRDAHAAHLSWGVRDFACAIEAALKEKNQ